MEKQDLSGVSYTELFAFAKKMDLVLEDADNKIGFKVYSPHFILLFETRYRGEAERQWFALWLQGYYDGKFVL